MNKSYEIGSVVTMEAIAQPPFMPHVVWHTSYSKEASIADGLLRHLRPRSRLLAGRRACHIRLRAAAGGTAATWGWSGVAGIIWLTVRCQGV